MRFFICLMILCGASVFSPDWPTFRGPQDNNITAETDWSSNAILPGKKRTIWWNYVGKGYANVSVKGDHVYTSGYHPGKRKETVYCFHAESGQIIWTHTFSRKPYRYNGAAATPTVFSHYLYYVSRNGDLFCYNRYNGNVIWRRSLLPDHSLQAGRYGICGSVYLYRDLCLVNAGGGIAVDRRNGKTIWVNKQKTSGYSTPVILSRKNDTGVLFFIKNALRLVNIRQGTVIWDYPWKTRDANTADPLVIADRVFISTFHENPRPVKGAALIDVSRSKPQKVWSHNLLKTLTSTAVHINGYLYGCDGYAGRGAGYLKCIHVESGRQQWRKRLGFFSLTAAEDGRLIIINEFGLLLIVKADPRRYRELARHGRIAPGRWWTKPVIANGRLYLRNARGKLWVFDMTP